jgi:glucose dehydrogenase
MRTLPFLVAFTTALVLSACSKPASQTAVAPAEAARPRIYAAVDEARLLAADQDAGQWMSHGRDYSEQRFSPLKRIDAANVGQLGLAWYADFDTRRGQESTPIVVDGVMYVTTAWSKLFAYDAKTGALLWKYDP